VRFNAFGTGSASIAPFVDPDPLVGDGLYDSLFTLTVPALAGGSVTVNQSPTAPVPEPATLSLLAAGGTLSALARRRKRRRDAAAG
jgi:hypothetical protein